MSRVKILEENEKSEIYTKVVKIGNEARIGVKLDDDKMIDLIFTKFTFHKGIAISNYSYFDDFLANNDRAIDEIINSAIQRGIMGIVTLTYTNLKSVEMLVENLNSIDLEVAVYSMMIDEITEKVFCLLK